MDISDKVLYVNKLKVDISKPIPYMVALLKINSLKQSSVGWNHLFIEYAQASNPDDRIIYAALISSISNSMHRFDKFVDSKLEEHLLSIYEKEIEKKLSALDSANCIGTSPDLSILRFKCENKRLKSVYRDTVSKCSRYFYNDKRSQRIKDILEYNPSTNKYSVTLFSHFEHLAYTCEVLSGPDGKVSSAKVLSAYSYLDNEDAGSPFTHVPPRKTSDYNRNFCNIYLDKNIFDLVYPYDNLAQKGMSIFTYGSLPIVADRCCQSGCNEKINAAVDKALDSYASQPPAESKTNRVVR